MANVRYLSVTQVRIFESEVLPAGFARMPIASSTLQQKFMFQQTTPAGPPISLDPSGALLLNNGEHEYQGRHYAVPQLLLESRRIVLIYLGPSAAANAMIDEVIEIVKAIDQFGKDKNYAPLILTEETSTVVKFDVPFAKLFSSGLIGTLQKNLDRYIDSPSAKVNLIPNSVKIRVSYTNIDDRLIKNGIQINDKELQIELRNQTDPAEGIFFIKSPNSSDKHNELVEYLEKTLQQA